MALSPARKLVYDFLKLPHHVQITIFSDLITPEELQMDVKDLFILAFQRAKGKGQEEALRHAIQRAIDDYQETFASPHPPPKPKFKVTPYQRWDKDIEITGPDGFRLLVDYDDVWQPTVNAQVKHLIEILNEHWTYEAPDIVGDDEK